MRLGPQTLQGRLALAIGAGITVIWMAAAAVTGLVMMHEIGEVFDSTLEETAQRILPVAAVEIIGRDEIGVDLRVATLRQHEEFFTYLVRDDQGRVLMRSHSAQEAVFPPFDGVGFRTTATHRIYHDAALRGAITISVAEPLAHRDAVARGIALNLALPLAVVIPLALGGIVVLVRANLAPLRRLRASLERRGAGDLSALPEGGLPAELVPVAQSVNRLMGRLDSALAAERSFAAHAAHELRTPLAAALAQTQRLIVEAGDGPAAARAGEIEAALRRLHRTAEKLLQLARAEGATLRTGAAPADLRPVLRLVAEDVARAEGAAGRIALALPEAPVLSDLDPDAVAALARNLIENALRHGAAGETVAVRLVPEAEGRGARLVVRNTGPVVPPQVLAGLSARFVRGATRSGGSGLGLAIARSISERAGGGLVLRSPVPGRADGFEAEADLGPATA